MRIAGWIMFVVGIVLGIWCLIASFTGDGLPFRVFIYIVILIFTGWRLKTYGTGLVATAGSPASAGPFDAVYNAADLAGKPTPEIATVALPFTPGVAELIRAAARKTGRVWGWTGGSFAAAFLLAGGFIARMGSLSDPDTVKALYILGAMIMLLVLGAGTGWLVQSSMPLRRDLGEGTYLRTRGPVEMVGMTTGYMLRLADRAFLVSKSPAAAWLARMDWAVIDYSRHLHVILGVWDSDGKNLFLADGYKPENLILVDAHVKM
jgi:hypothetical protein